MYFCFLIQLAEVKSELSSSQQKVENLQRDKQRLEGELDEAERQLKVTKARQAKQAAAREEGKESKVSWPLYSVVGIKF
jgi:septal ring factor EnvC (AmiA/AmiB activator)